MKAPVLLTVGLCAIVRNEKPFIQEWVAFHHLQGVSRLLVFDNDSTDGTGDLLRGARDQAGVSVINLQNGGGRFDVIQRKAYEHGARLLAGQVDLALFIDADEFVLAENTSLGAAFA